MDIRATTVLPAERREITLHTADGLELIGELALPPDGWTPVATLLTLHPLPTAEGMMDSHVLRKASFRLPALADVAVLRFNTRGTSSRHGTSEGEFGEGETEKHDVMAAIEFTEFEGLPSPWLVGWSFGTELALKWGCDPQIEGAMLLSPPLHRADEGDMKVWADSGKPVVALVPEHDDFLQPEGAARRFEPLTQAEIIGVDGAKHLWVGEPYVRRVLDEIVKRVNPDAYPLPTEWDGPYERDVQPPR